MKNRSLMPLLVSVVLVCLALAADQKPKNSALIEKEFAAWNAHDPDKVASFYTDDVVYEDVAYGMTAHGHAEMRKLAADFFAAVPDLKLEPVNSFVENGHGSVEWVFSGTDAGLYKTGKKFSVRGASLFEVRDGKFLRNKDFYDSATIMRQVGALPEAKPAGSSQ